MATLKVRKNLILDKELVEEVKEIIKAKHKNFSETVNLFLKAVTKNPKLLDTVEQDAKKADDSFVGMLSGEIGDIDYKQMQGMHAEKMH